MAYRIKTWYRASQREQDDHIPECLRPSADMPRPICCLHSLRPPPHTCRPSVCTYGSVDFLLSLFCVHPQVCKFFPKQPSLEPAGAESGMYVHTPTFNLTGIEYEQTRPNPSTASTSEALFDSACSWKPTRKPSVPSCLPPRCSMLPVAQPARNRLS